MNHQWFSLIRLFDFRILNKCIIKWNAFQLVKHHIAGNGYIPTSTVNTYHTIPFDLNQSKNHHHHRIDWFLNERGTHNNNGWVTIGPYSRQLIYQHKRKERKNRINFNLGNHHGTQTILSAIGKRISIILHSKTECFL